MQLETNKSVITPLGVFIIGTYDKNGVPNAMNVAWETQNEMDEIVLCLGKHKTTENLKKTLLQYQITLALKAEQM